MWLLVRIIDIFSKAEGVDEARLDMFARKQKLYEAISPTRAALKQHVKRAAYQAGCIWSQSTLRQPETQTPANWGWIKKERRYVVDHLDRVPTHCRELLNKCG